MWIEVLQEIISEVNPVDDPDLQTLHGSCLLLECEGIINYSGVGERSRCNSESRCNHKGYAPAQPCWSHLIPATQQVGSSNLPGTSIPMVWLTIIRQGLDNG